MRRPIALILAGALVLLFTGPARADTVTFNSVGATQFWDVPAGVTQATFDLYGAQGGGSVGGNGARVRVTFGVTPLERLYILVGGQGGSGTVGFNGGGAGGASSGGVPNGYGGGGATDVRRGGTTLASRLSVAAGGGGRGSQGTGSAGGQSGADAPDPAASCTGRAPVGNQGGTPGIPGCGNKGQPGDLGVGGAGQANGGGGGGGGGGLYGGGGGGGQPNQGNYQGYGGGGGSSMIARSDLVVGAGAVLQNGARGGDGSASVTFTPGPVTTTTGTTGGQGTASLVDTVKPVLGRLGFSRTTFAAASSGASISATSKRKKLPVGTKVSFSLSEPGSVRFTVQRKAAGRRVAKKCVTPKRSNRKKKKCTRWKSVRGAFTVSGKAGRNTFTFRGRMGGKALSRGSYRLIGVATDGARNASASVNRSFRIVK